MPGFSCGGPKLRAVRPVLARNHPINMKDRYFKYLAATIVVGVVLAIFNPAHATEQTTVRLNPPALPANR